jgi:hypothetical protein
MMRHIWRMGVRVSEIDFKGDEGLGDSYWDRWVGALRQWSGEENIFSG